MAELTEEEKCAKYYYEFNRFQTAMKDYADSISHITMCRNKKRQLEKNDQHLVLDEQAKGVQVWEGHLASFEEKSRDYIRQASESFSIMRSLLEPATKATVAKSKKVTSSTKTVRKSK